MRYLDEQSDERRDPRALLASARTLVTVALSYAHADPADVPADRLARGPRGRIARYARGDDYHVVLKTKLRALADAVARASRRARSRSCPASTPRPCSSARPPPAGGLGFLAKNTMLIAPGLGSYVLLGELADRPRLRARPARRRRAALRPVHALPRRLPDRRVRRRLHARRAPLHLVPHDREPGAIPRELRPLIGDHVFGCDVCQDVCPFNAADEPARRPSSRRATATRRPSLVAPARPRRRAVPQVAARLGAAPRPPRRSSCATSPSRSATPAASTSCRRSCTRSASPRRWCARTSPGPSPQIVARIAAAHRRARRCAGVAARRGPGARDRRRRARRARASRGQFSS